MDVSLPQKYLVKNNCNIPAGFFYLSCHFVTNDVFETYQESLAETQTLSGALIAASVDVGNGTVALPSLSIGETNTGLYYVSSTQTGFSQDGVLVGGYNATGLFTDVISEQTSTVGVTVDGVILKDGGVEVTKGNVTQLTSIVTGVTSTASAGTITTVSATTAAGASDSFIVTTPFAKTTSKIFLTANSAGTGIPYAVVSTKTNGTFTIKLLNVAATDPLNAVVTIDFLIV